MRAESKLERLLHRLDHPDCFADSTERNLMAEAAATIRELASPWQPIETAPKDGRTILGWDRLATRAYTMRWGHSVSIYVLREWWGEGGAERPTHWMPLPKPPAAGGADA